MKDAIYRFGFVVSGLIALGLCDVRADDALPPGWRGVVGTTFQHWRFDTNVNPAAPELYTNGAGVPEAVIELGQGAGGWIDTLWLLGTNQGVWDLGRNGKITFTVPNQECTNGCWKFIVVQVTQYRDSIYNEMAQVSVSGATCITVQAKTNAITPFNGRWVVEQSVWLVEYCPSMEAVTITAGWNSSAIDQVVIDTYCSSGDDGDVFPPCWRGAEGSTYQNWSFHRQLNPVGPEHKNSPGEPSALVAVGSYGLGWQDQIPGLGHRQGFWDLGMGGTITLTVTNFAGSPSSYKYARVQVVQYLDSLIYNTPVTVEVPDGIQIGTGQQAVLETTPFGAQWVVFQSLWRLAPSPVQESVIITAPMTGALVDQVVVDTLALDFVCPADIVVATDPGQCTKSNVVWSMPPVDGCVVTNVICTPAVGSTFPVGTNPVSCLIQDGEGGNFICNFTVIVRDAEPPVARCRDVTVDLDATGNATITAAQVDDGSTDNCGIRSMRVDPSSFTCADQGTNLVTLTVTDLYENIATCNARVIVRDSMRPEITCPETPQILYVNTGTCKAAVPDYLAELVVSDNCGTVVCTQYPPAGAEVELGVTNVTIIARDGANNQAECQVTIIVADPVTEVSLGIEYREPEVVISWPKTCATWTLQETPSLNLPIVWSDSTNTPVLVGENWEVSISPADKKFYRLKRNLP